MTLLVPHTHNFSDLTLSTSFLHRHRLLRSGSFNSICKRRHFAAESPCFTSTRSTSFKIMAGVGLYPASISWWKKGSQTSNMRDITSSDQFFEALSAAATQDKLVLVDFYAAGCPSCKAIFPKICQIARDNPNVVILKVNFYDNDVLCRSLKVKMLPFFHFYRGAEGRVAAFSCSLSKISKLREAVEKYQEHQLIAAALS